jgi:hypothetical protein
LVSPIVYRNDGGFNFRKRIPELGGVRNAQTLRDYSKVIKERKRSLG